MRAAELWILAYLLNSLWQVPLVFCAAWLVASMTRPIGVRMEHRVWALALSLQVLLPVCSLHVGRLSQFASSIVSWMHGGSGTDGVVRVVTGPPNVAEAALLRLPSAVLWTMLMVYAGSVLYFAARLAWGAWKTEAIRRSAAALNYNDEWSGVMAKLDRPLQAKLSSLHIATSQRIAGPAMLGVFRPTLLLPPAFVERLSQEELYALLGHELAHIQRHDFAKNLFYGFMSLPIAYHPLLWLTRARLTETRELTCDAMAANSAGGQENYARSLLRLAAILSGLADRAEPQITHAVGIFDANNFERRVMRLTRKQLPIGRARQAFVVLACLLVAFSTCLSALAWRIDVNSPPQKTVKRVAVSDKNLTLVHKVDPVYPEEAKKEGLSGSVVLALHISKDGVVENIRVVKGSRVFQASALDAVKQWRYQPFLLNGDPIAVDTQVTVEFSPK